MTKEEIKEIAEDYLLYLKTGAFRNVSVEKDIQVCSDFISILEKPFSRLHNDAIKNAYIEKASMFKDFYSGRVGVDEKIIRVVIDSCEKVLEDPNYRNCAALDDVLELAGPDEYAGVPAENGEQDLIHRKLWRYINRTLELL